MSAPAWVRRLLPTGARVWLRRTFGWRWMRGNYRDWESARLAAGSQGGSAALARVIAAAHAVRAGRAAWDRDGVLFSRPWVHGPLLTALREIARVEGGRLCLVDFGGGLGSTWWQHRDALSSFGSIDWRIVELPPLVAAGREAFAAPPISFHSSLDEALCDGKPSALLLSSVLQYLSAPHELLGTASGKGLHHLVLDRVPLQVGPAHRLVVQHTPPKYGGGASPCWLFARAGLLAPLTHEYELVYEWVDDFDQVDGAAEFGGFWFRRRECQPRGGPLP